MSWVTVIWSMVASACLTLAAVHLMVWYRKRTEWSNLLFFLAALGTAALGLTELWMMRAETPAEFGTALRWLHVAAWGIIVSLIGFVRVYLQSGRRWLAWTACALRTLSLLLNFLIGQNLNYLEVTRLQRILFLGESVSVAEGRSNPWMLVGQLSLLLVVVFLTDATLGVWRRGDRRKALMFGGSIVFFVSVGTAQSVLVLWQIVHWPYAPSLPFLGVLAVMAWEMSRETIRAAQLADDLRASETRMALAAEATGVGVWMWSIARNQVWGSDQWLGLFGFAPDEAITFEKVIQRIHPDDRGTVEREVRRALADQSQYMADFRVVLLDGTQRWIAARGRMYQDSHGKPARMPGTAVDITPRKQLEMQIQQQRSELAHRARVSMIGQLASSLAHELNQPLGAILRNAEAGELLLQDPSPDLDELQAILEDIRGEDQRAGHVIDRMRSMMKRREPERHRVNLDVLVDEVVALVRPDAERRRVRLVRETGAAVPPVQGDRIQLQQVLLNLLVNAMEALDDNPPTARVVTLRTQLADRTVEVAVSDNGQGIPEDRLPRMFEPFLTSKPNGLGMGLAISKGIIEAHGGRLWAENNATGGATFTFVLPVEEGGDTR